MAQYGGGHGDHQNYGGSAFGYPTANFPGQNQNNAPDNNQPPANNDFGQQAILDQNDSNLMSSFFDDPNFDISQMDHKTDHSGLFDFTNAPQTFPNQGASSQAHPSYSSHHNNYRTSSDGQLFQHGNFGSSFTMNNQNQNQSQGHAHDEAVFNTASTLVGLSNSQAQDAQQSLGPNNMSAWGSFSTNNPTIMPSDDSASPLDSSGRGSAGSGYPNHMQTAGQSLPPQQHAQFLQSRLSQMQYHPGVPRIRHSFNAIDTTGAQAFGQHMGQSGRSHSYLQGRPTPNMVRFGSDDAFGAAGFRGSSIGTEQEKELNLTNVPLAEQAAGSFQQHLQRTMSHPNTGNYRQGHVRGMHSQSASPADVHQNFANPFASPVSGLQQHMQHSWPRATEHAVAEDDEEEVEEESQPRKRRKSGMPREDDGDYQPRAPGQAPQRGPKVPKAEGTLDDADLDEFTTPNRSKNSAKRKSTHSTVAPATPPDQSTSPGGGPSSSKKARQEAKARANLTEAEKRNNHIQSEQKRRNVIKQGYSDLNEIVPSLAGGKSGLSKAEVLKEVVTFLENTVVGNDTMQEVIARQRDDDANFDPGEGSSTHGLPPGGGGYN